MQIRLLDPSNLCDPLKWDPHETYQYSTRIDLGDDQHINLEVVLVYLGTHSTGSVAGFRFASISPHERLELMRLLA